jgi:hypothetical protein
MTAVTPPFEELAGASVVNYPRDERETISLHHQRIE